jgi:hypothetical protein
LRSSFFFKLNVEIQYGGGNCMRGGNLSMIFHTCLTFLEGFHKQPTHFNFGKATWFQHDS